MKTQRVLTALCVTALAACSESETGGGVTGAEAPSQFAVVALDRPVLGLWLGRRLDRQLERCPEQGNPKDYCVRDGRPVGPNTKGGGVALAPPRDANFGMPGWVRTVAINIREDGTVVTLDVETDGVDKQDAIIAAATERFGRPTWQETTEYQNGFGARRLVKKTSWDTTDASAYFSCVVLDKCFFIIRTSEEQRRVNEVAAKFRQKEKF